MPHVCLLTPVKNRAWALPAYFECLLALDQGNNTLSLLFLDDASTDATPTLLEAFQADCAHRFASITILKNDDAFGDNTSSRDMAAGLRKYRHLAYLRNSLLLHAEDENPDYVFSMESDVLLFPDCLTALIARQVPCVTPVLFLDAAAKGGLYWDSWLGHRVNGDANVGGRPFSRYTGMGCQEHHLYEIFCGGGVFLLTKDAFACHPEMGPSLYGEEWPLYVTLHQAGFACYLDTERHAIHVMEAAYLPEALAILHQHVPDFDTRVHRTIPPMVEANPYDDPPPKPTRKAKRG